jgi:hypothetical protein
MDADDYQRGAAETAIYPGQGEALGLAYCYGGLAGGAGAVCNQAKKAIRDDGISLTPERIAKIKHFLGENQWYAAQLCNELELRLSEVQEENLALLADRKERGVLRGDGEDR